MSDNWYKDVDITKAREDLGVKFASTTVGETEESWTVTVAHGPDGQFGISVCNPNDSFNRKLGQAIALRRMQAGTGRFAGVHNFKNNGGNAALEAMERVYAADPGTVTDKYFGYDLNETAKARSNYLR